MYRVFAPVFASHLRRSLATNSGPLSERMFRNSLPDHDIGHGADHFRRTPAPLSTDQQALSRVLIDQVQDAHTAAIVRPCAHEVVAPHMICVCRSQPHARSIVEPQPPSRLLLLWNLQPFAAPDSLDSVLTHVPAGPLEQCRDPTIAVTAILAG